MAAPPLGCATLTHLGVTGVALLGLVGLALAFFSGYRFTRAEHAAIRTRLGTRSGDVSGTAPRPT